jgi:hypothetical protein
MAPTKQTGAQPNAVAETLNAQITEALQQANILDPMTKVMVEAVTSAYDHDSETHSIQIKGVLDNRSIRARRAQAGLSETINAQLKAKKVNTNGKSRAKQKKDKAKKEGKKP